MNLDMFIKLIQDRIQFYQQQVEQSMEQNHSTFEKYQRLCSLLEEDISNITGISLEEIQEVLDESLLSSDEKETEFKYLKLIRNLLELNQTKGTTFQLSDQQKHYLVYFQRQINELKDLAEVAVQEQMVEVESITTKIRGLRTLLGKVEDSKNIEYISEEELLKDLMSSLDAVGQMDLLCFILKYNHELYQKRMTQQEMEERPRLNMEEVRDLFQTYSYDFDHLKDEYKEYLLSYGNMDQMIEIFECLNQCQFPHFDLRRDGKKLVAILINSNTQVIKEIVSYSREKGINPRDLLMIIPAMVKQTKRHSGEGGTCFERTSLVTGRSDDYKKNILFLEQIGFDISFIFHKCKEILVMSNAKLVSNYRKFILYGFTISRDECGRLCHPALSCLMSNNFDAIVDQFIEISRDGHQYIKDNMSRVSTTSSPRDLLFYNIYASYLTQDEMGEELVPEGPFVGNSRTRLRLRGEILRYSGSGFENVPYRGITEDNKLSKTMTVEVECANKDEFDSAIEKHIGDEDELYNLVFDDERILALESYVDINDPLRYDFGGILISKQKVKRIFNILKNEHLDELEDSLLYALTYNSILSQDAMDKIRRIVNDRRK